MIGIYKITSNDTGKCYIGQSIDIETRWKQHICEARYEKKKNINNKFHNALIKYGENNFTYEIIEECENNQTVLDEREKYWINYYNSVQDGYNTQYGGHNLTWEYDPEIIRKMWDDGYTTGQIKSILGSSDTLIRARLNGYKDYNTFTSHQRSCGGNMLEDSRVNKVPVHQYSLLGEYITSYPTLGSATRAMGSTCTDNIRKCIQGKQRTAYNYQWSLEKVDKMPMTSTAQGKLVHCITTDMYFSSVPEATKWAGLKGYSSIKGCCQGRNKTAGKHPITGEKLRWEYVENMP